jgi:hypothetical protein
MCAEGGHGSFWHLRRIMNVRQFEFVINIQTARMLNLAVSSSLLACADEVIEQV